MRNNSTFNYLINFYRTDSQGNNTKSIDSDLEEFLISMDSEDFSPSDSSVEAILNFAGSFDVVCTKQAGIVELNLN